MPCRIAVFFMLSILSGAILAQPPGPAPLTEEGHRFGETEIEKAAFPEIDETIGRMEYGGYLHEDDSLLAYLQGILSNVMPPELGWLNPRIVVLKSPEVNAGMYMNGVLQINTGMLAVLDNEAQLAFVICHELAHLINRHSLQKYIRKEALDDTKLRWDEKRDLFLEYSREVELEADSLGWELFLQSPYSPPEAVAAIGKLPVMDSLKFDFFARLLGFSPPLPTHPKNAIREDFLRKKLEELQPRNGAMGEDAFHRHTRQMSRINIDMLRLSGSNFDALSMLDTLEKTITDSRSGYFREIQLAKGEVCAEILAEPMRSGTTLVSREEKKVGAVSPQKAIEFFNREKPEIERKAFEALNPLLEDEQLAHRAHRTLGMIHYRNHDFEKAKSHFSSYLNSGKEIPDKRYIHSLLKEMEGK